MYASANCVLSAHKPPERWRRIMRTLLTLSAIALLAGTMSAYAIDQQASEEATGTAGVAVSAPFYPAGARAQVPTGTADAIVAPAFTAPAAMAPVDSQDPALSR